MREPREVGVEMRYGRRSVMAPFLRDSVGEDQVYFPSLTTGSEAMSITPC
jgi:hypothetical protein